MDPNADVPELVLVSPPRKKIKADAPRRLVVDSLHLSTLMAFSRSTLERIQTGVRRAVKQTIPTKIWERVYEDYISVVREDVPRGPVRIDPMVTKGTGAY
jgi:hypothetical protein